MVNKPLVSVVMPAYNTQEFIVSAIQSILDQTYKKFEFIIIDDGSTDHTSTLIKRLKDKRLVVIKNSENLGVTRSLNKALDIVRGKYVIRMDADDWSYPRRIERQVELMESNPNVVVSGSYIEICDANLNVQYLRKYKQDDKDIRDRLFRYSPFAHPATIWRAADLKQEKYNVSAINVEDYELYFRIGRRGEFKNINEPLLKLRMHSKSISFSMNDRQSDATIQIRWDAVNKYGYTMNLADKIYNILQATIIRLMPVRSRFWLFNLLRKIDAY